MNPLINPMRPCFLKPWSLLAGVSGSFLVIVCLLWRVILRNRHYLSWELAGDSQSSFSISHQKFGGEPPLWTCWWAIRWETVGTLLEWELKWNPSVRIIFHFKIKLINFYLFHFILGLLHDVLAQGMFWCVSAVCTGEEKIKLSE